MWSVSLSLALAPLRILEFIDGELPITGFHEVCHPINLGALNVILVTSANGHIGKEVVNVLHSRGEGARVLRAHVRVLQPARLNRQLERTRLATRKKADRLSRIRSAGKCRRAVTSAERQ